MIPINQYPTKPDRNGRSRGLTTMMKTTAPLLAFLALAMLLGGCATQPPYPPLPEDLEPQQAESSESEAVADTADGASRTSLVPGAGANLPLPPDPESLPPANKRQLDVRLASQTFNYFEDGELVWSGPISSGAPAHPTPKGRYTVLSKDIDKRSGSYTNSFDQPTPMPYSLQFYGPYFVHEGWLPGHAASHGCVRLRYEDARFVYSRMRVGDRLIVED
jgi:lipoprotein-anchoring transpeptidase ErfK/SrfK